MQQLARLAMAATAVGTAVVVVLGATGGDGDVSGEARPIDLSEDRPGPGSTEPPLLDDVAVVSPDPRRLGPEASADAVPVGPDAGLRGASLTDEDRGDDDGDGARGDDGGSDDGGSDDGGSDDGGSDDGGSDESGSDGDDDGGDGGDDG